MRKSHFTLDADIHCALRPDDANQNSSKKSKLIFFSGLCLGLSLCLSFRKDQKPLFKAPIHQSK